MENSTNYFDEMTAGMRKEGMVDVAEFLAHVNQKGQVKEAADGAKAERGGSLDGQNKSNERKLPSQRQAEYFVDKGSNQANNGAVFRKIGRQHDHDLK